MNSEYLTAIRRSSSALASIGAETDEVTLLLISAETSNHFPFCFQPKQFFSVSAIFTKI